MRFNPIISASAIILISFIISYCNAQQYIIENKFELTYLIIETICSLAIVVIIIYKRFFPIKCNLLTLVFLASLEIIIWSAIQQSNKNVLAFQIQILIIYIGGQQSFRYLDIILTFCQMLNVVDFKQEQIFQIQIGGIIGVLITSNCYFMYKYYMNKAKPIKSNQELEQTLHLPLSQLDRTHSIQITKRQEHKFDQELTNFSNSQQFVEFKKLLNNQKIILINKNMEVDEVNFEISSYFNKDHQNDDNIKDFFSLQASKLFDNDTKTIKELLKEIYISIKQCVVLKVKKQTDCNFKNVFLIVFPLPEYSDIKIIIHFIDVQKQYLKLKEKQKLVLNDTFKSLSHELGTNLNSILTYSAVAMEDLNLPPEIQQNYIRPIQINSQQLNLIVSNIRDYNLINMQQFDLKIEEFRIDSAINKVNQLFTDILREKNIKLNIQILLENKKIVSDNNRFSQVYFQILQNSIKYTRDQVICVKVKKIQDLIEIVISDEGEGMNGVEFEKVNKILNQSEFIRVSSKSVGIGMGLGISNAIVKLLNQNNSPIICQQKSKGVQFTFTIKNHTQELENVEQSQIEFLSNSSGIRLFPQNLYFEGHSKFDVMSFQNVSSFLITPISKAYKQNTKLKLNSEQQLCQLNDEESFKIQIAPLFVTQLQNDIIDCNLHTKCCSRVLIIDDEYFNIQCLTLQLRQYKTICDSAYNGKEALDKIEYKLRHPCEHCSNQHYALIFFDINMPIMDGYECVQNVQKWIKEEKIRKCWCVANSGFSDLSTKLRAYKSGMDFYLTKPINHEDLEEIIIKMFPLKQNKN